MVEIEINSVLNVKVALEFIKKINGGAEEILDTGFLQAWNCTPEVNCTKNMRGNHVYYLSGAQNLTLITVSTGNSSSINLDVTIRESAKGVGFQIMICIVLLAIYTLYFRKSIRWMRSSMDQELASQKRFDTENLDTLLTKSDDDDGGNDNIRKF